MEYTIRKENVFIAADDAEKGRFEVGEDEFIVDSEWRGANRIVVVIAQPVVTEYHCGKNGCSRTVDGPDDRCWQHEGDDE